MIGLAQMAWKLAWHRRSPVLDGIPCKTDPYTRAELIPEMDVSTEYYRIIDRLTCREKP